MKKIEKDILEKIKEIKKIYLDEYPNGEYLTIAIIDGNITFNNEYWDKDKDFVIDVWERCEEDE